MCVYVDKCALKRVSVLINLRSTTQLNTIVPWLKRPKLYTLCEKREREREKRSIHINTKSAKNPRPKNNAKQTISHLHFPSLFFLAFSKATTTKSHTLNTKKTHNVVIWFFTILAGLAVHTYKRDTHNKWFYVFHIFFGVCIRKRSTPVWWSSVSVVLTPRCMCV